MNAAALLRLAADQDQDRARAERWWADASGAEKLLVLERITRPYDDPVMELMSRFAQLAFIEMALAEARRPTS
jgi:hypothetical protein